MCLRIGLLLELYQMSSRYKYNVYIGGRFLFKFIECQSFKRFLSLRPSHVNASKGKLMVKRKRHVLIEWLYYCLLFNVMFRNNTSKLKTWITYDFKFPFTWDQHHISLMVGHWKPLFHCHTNLFLKLLFYRLCRLITCNYTWHNIWIHVYVIILNYFIIQNLYGVLARKLGESCSDAIECLTSNPNSTCNQSKNVCECKEGYMEVLNTCTKGKV